MQTCMLLWKHHGSVLVSEKAKFCYAGLRGDKVLLRWSLKRQSSVTLVSKEAKFFYAGLRGGKVFLQACFYEEVIKA